MNKQRIGIVGFGFVGSAIAHGFSLHADIKIYDKYNNIFDTLDDTVNSSDFLFICVPTPMKDDGSQDLSSIYESIEEINKLAKERKIIILKSTIVPGTTRDLSRKYSDHHFIFNPEFLTERSAKLDFINQSRIIIGYFESQEDSEKRVEELYRTRFIHTPIFKCKWEEAELLKYMCNCFFAVKISFVNEIYQICQRMGIDYQVMKKMFLADGRIGNSHCDVPGHDGQAGFSGKCVPGFSSVLTEGNKLITIEKLYNKYIKNKKLPKIQSCNKDFNEKNFKQVVGVTKRSVIDEDLLIFETNNGNFICTKEHLMPIYRNENYLLVQAKDILTTDELIYDEEKVLCRLGCGQEAKYSLHKNPRCSNYASQCPEVRKLNSQNTKITMSNPKWRKRRSEAAKEICSKKEFREDMSRKLKKIYENPELRNKISDCVKQAFKKDPTNRVRQAKTMRERKRNVGETNGMKKQEAKDKVSKFRKEFFKNKENRLRLSVKVADAWKNGKFDKVRTGRCKWYLFKSKDMKEYKVQGTWELSFIKWLDNNNLSFTCHKGRINYILNGVNRTYYPDFFIKEWNCFIDIKCSYFLKPEKIKAIVECNPDLNIKILTEKELKELGVEINEKTKDFKHLEC